MQCQVILPVSSRNFLFANLWPRLRYDVFHRRTVVIHSPENLFLPNIDTCSKVTLRHEADTGGKMHQTPSVLLTNNKELIDLVEPIAAACGHPLLHHRSLDHAQPEWRNAPMVLIGADLAEACIGAVTPVRNDIIVIDWQSDNKSPLWPSAIQLGASGIIDLPEASDWLYDRFVRINAKATSAPVLAVTAGSGGVGASTLAAATATYTANCGKTTVLVDLDHTGGGVDDLVGLRHAAGWRWPALSHCSGVLDAPQLLPALPSRGHLHVLSHRPGESGYLTPDSVTAVIHAARLMADVVVLDLARTADPATTAAAHIASCGVLVVAPHRQGVAAASTVANRYGQLWSRLGTVHRQPGPNRAARSSASLSATDVNHALDLPQWGTLPHAPPLTARLQCGSMQLTRLARLNPQQRRTESAYRSLCALLWAQSDIESFSYSEVLP